MKYRMMVAALAILATPAAAGDLPRLAQAMEMVPLYEVLTIVRSARLDPIGRPVRRGPTYVLHAIDDDDREVRVVVDARYGEIMSITPVMMASRDVPLRELPPRRGIGPYDRTPDDYGPPMHRSGPPIIYRSEPPLDRPRVGLPDDPRSAGQALPPARGGEPSVIYGDRPFTRGGESPPVIYGDRPPGRMPNEPLYGPPPARGAAPPPVIAATPPDGIDRRPLSDPRSISPTAPQANRDTDVGTRTGPDGLLPPPPERFPQRAPPPAAKPTPAPKRAAATPPKQAPLPKPRPADAAKVDAAPSPPKSAAEPPKKTAGDEVPN